jgi:hypothetical protein
MWLVVDTDGIGSPPGYCRARIEPALYSTVGKK